MNKTQFTPGPWHVGMKPGPIVYGPQGEQVANMHVAMLDQDEHKANARLIAAAPDLLETLKHLRAEIRAVIKFDVKKHYSLIVADVAADKAIAKAEGK